jgi:hypothetical protein
MPFIISALKFDYLFPVYLRVRSSEPVHVRLTKEAERLREQQKKAEERKVEEELNQCTFSPDLSPSSGPIANSSGVLKGRRLSGDLARSSSADIAETKPASPAAVTRHISGSKTSIAVAQTPPPVVAKADTPSEVAKPPAAAPSAERPADKPPVVTPALATEPLRPAGLKPAVAPAAAAASPASAPPVQAAVPAVPAPAVSSPLQLNVSTSVAETASPAQKPLSPVSSRVNQMIQALERKSSSENIPTPPAAARSPLERKPPSESPAAAAVPPPAVSAAPRPLLTPTLSSGALPAGLQPVPSGLSPQPPASRPISLTPAPAGLSPAPAFNVSSLQRVPRTNSDGSISAPVPQVAVTSPPGN